MFETSCNMVVMGKTEVNMAYQRGPNCIGIAASLHLQQKLLLQVQQKSHV